MQDNEITEKIIQCAIKVHKSVGPGLLESAYRECLNYEMIQSGLNVLKERPLPIIYEDVKLDCCYRIDFLVEDKIIVEIKSVECLNDVHAAQLLTYLKILDRHIGLLINFNVVLLKYGIRRVINGFEAETDHL